MRKIERVRELVIMSINEAGDRSAVDTNPSHDMIEGTKVFIKAAVDFLCSIVDTNKLEANDDDDDEAVKRVADAIVYRVCKMLAVAGGRV